MTNGVTVFPGGVSTTDNGVFHKAPFPDPFQYHIYKNDFDTYVSGDWTVTKPGSGTTIALADGSGGLLSLANTSTDDDLISHQLAIESFKFVANKKAFFAIKFKIDDATQCDFTVGLVLRDTTPLAFTDGCGFTKADGSTAISFTSLKNSSGTTKTSAATFVNDTFITLGYYFDGNKFYVYADDQLVHTTAVNATICDDEELTVTFAFQNGSAAARTMTVDYVFAGVER